MAARWKNMLGWNMLLDNSGKIWLESQDVLATNDVWDGLILRIDEAGANNAQLTTRVGVHGRFEVPQDYVDTAVVIPIWTATITSGNVVWDLDYRNVGGDDAESLDQSGTQGSASVTDACPSAAWERNTPSIDVTDGDFVAGDTCQFFLARDGTDANDTAAGASLLYALMFQYDDGS